MSVQIDKVLPRRSDLGTFLVHLTRSTEKSAAKDVLKSIIQDRKLIAKSPFGQAYEAMRKANWNTQEQNCVCFTEAPLEHIPWLLENIEGRSVKMEPYGIAITKRQGRIRDANPIWYVDQTKGHDWLTKPINRMIDAAIRYDRPKHAVLMLTPFFEQFGDYKDFHWEREWRKVGDFELPNLYLVIAPET